MGQQEPEDAEKNCKRQETPNPARKSDYRVTQRSTYVLGNPIGHVLGGSIRFLGEMHTEEKRKEEKRFFCERKRDSE